MGSFTQPSMQGGGGYGYFAPPTGPYGLQPDSARKRPRDCYLCERRDRRYRYRRSLDNHEAHINATTRKLNETEPLIVKVKLSDIKKRDHIIRLLPAMKAIKEKMKYSLIDEEGQETNDTKHFKIREKNEASFLQVTKDLPHPGLYKIRLRILPEINRKELRKEFGKGREVRKVKKEMKKEIDFEIQLNLLK